MTDLRAQALAAKAVKDAEREERHQAAFRSACREASQLTKNKLELDVPLDAWSAYDADTTAMWNPDKYAVYVIHDDLKLVVRKRYRSGRRDTELCVADLSKRRTDDQAELVPIFNLENLGDVLHRLGPKALVSVQKAPSPPAPVRVPWFRRSRR